MSKNYTKYSNYSKTQEAPVAPEVTEEVVETVIEEETQEAPVEAAVETEAAPEPEVEDDALIGVVTECAKLNVRKEPAADAEILTTVPLGAEVKVDIFESVGDYFKVCTGAGVEGYCVKDYINID